MTTAIEGRHGAPVPIREAQAAAVRMVEARNALRARVLQARADLASAPAHDREAARARARLAEVRHQYDVVREGARHALDHLAVAVAQDASG